MPRAEEFISETSAKTCAEALKQFAAADRIIK
jgi:hypothetical protein